MFFTLDMPVKSQPQKWRTKLLAQFKSMNIVKVKKKKIVWSLIANAWGFS